MAEFVRHTSCESCGSSDANALYSNGTTYCFACEKSTFPEGYFKDNTDDSKKVIKTVKVQASTKVSDLAPEKIQEINNKKEKVLASKEVLTEEEHDEIKNRSAFEAKNYRSIRDDVCKFYGCRTELNSEGEVKNRFYPSTVNDQLTGYKIRKHPKTFSTEGLVGNTSDLYGAFRFRAGGKYCVPMTTKALTRRGWLGYNEITTDDYVLAYNAKTKTKEWTKVLEKHKRSDLEVFEFGAGKQRFQSTENHRWFVKQRTTLSDNSIKVHKEEIRTLSSFTTETSLIVNAKTNENLSKSNLELAQNKYETDWVQKVIEMTQEQRVSFLEGVLISDGCYHGTYWSLAQNDGPLFEAMLLASYLVHDKIVRVKKMKVSVTGKTIKHVVLSNSENRSRLLENKTSLGVQETWCITTALDSWVIRQNDLITITGNCLIVGGEEDAHAAYQMMLDYSRSKNSDYVTAVVSVSVGEGNPSKQLANNYEFLNSFEHIVLGFDSDESGRNAVEKVIGALPKGKVRVAKWTKAKDPNEYLERGDSKTFLRDFYAAETYLPAGVLGSDKLYEKIMQQTFEKKVSFPPFMKQLNTMLAGGLPLGHIVNLAAATSIGKTTLVNELIYFWLFNSPHRVGVVSLESDAGQYGESLLSRHLSKKLSLIADEEEKRSYLSSSDVKQAAEILFQTQDGDPRFYLVDDRDGTVEQLQEVIEQMVISSGCKIVIIDPIQDIFAGLTIEEQESFMKWCKSMIKSHKITFVLVNHIRKAASGDKSRISESDIHGSSTLIKSASINILLSRDKMHEDENLRNTTEIDLPKNRVCGITGPAGAIYYDNLSHTLFDYEDYFGEPYVKPVQQKH